MVKKNTTQVQRASASQRKQQSMKDKMANALARLPKGTFAKGGGLIGGALAGPSGAAIGTAIGAGISTVTGYGDYVVRQNTILKGGLSHDLEKSPVDDLPQFVRGAHTVNVKHREYFGDLLVPVNPTVFNNTAYVIQPSNTTLFPWLARIARQYQQYRIRGMVVEFKSNTTDYAAAGPLGSVGIATNYNVVDQKFDNLIEFQNCEFAVVSKPSRNILHAIECSPSIGRGEWLYVRDVDNEDPAVAQDARFNDFGKLQVCTSGLPGTPGQTLGQLWVSYDIEFAKPLLGSSDPGPVTTPGALAVSTPDTGVLSSTPQSGLMVRSWGNSAVTPVGNATYDVFSNAIVVSGSGNIAASVVELSSIDNSMKVKRPGKYVVAYRLDSVNGTGTNYHLNVASGALTSQLAISLTGSAAATLSTFSNRLPHVPTTTANGSFSSALVYWLDVTTASDTDQVVIVPPRFTTFNGTVIANFTAYLEVQWIATAPGSYL